MRYRRMEKEVAADEVIDWKGEEAARKISEPRGNLTTSPGRKPNMVEGEMMNREELTRRRLVSDPEEILEWLKQPNHLIDGTQDKLVALGVLGMWISGLEPPAILPEADVSFSTIKDMLNKGLLELEIRFRMVSVRLPIPSGETIKHEEDMG